MSQLFTLSAFVLSTVSFTGCVNAVDTGDNPFEQLEPSSEREQGIINGALPSVARHDAVVAIHQRYGSSVSNTSFCTGTLITPTVVITAAHCIEGLSAASLAIYVGDNPTIDPSPTFVPASEVWWHPSYSAFTNLHDVALMRLGAAVQGVTPVPPLPPELGLSSSDAGLALEFVGFGRTENGSSDQKLVAGGTFATVGCGVSGCPGGLQSSSAKAAMFSYRQPNEGPCQGDSGGPAFVERGGDVYVAGMTSFGDANCTWWGVSARADSYAAEIESFVGGAIDAPAAPPASEPVDEDEPQAGAVGGDYGYVSDPLTSEQGYYYPFTLAIPAGDGPVTVAISGGSGDADLYVRRGGPVSIENYDCRPYVEGNDETCTFDDAAGGTYEVWVVAFSPFSNVTLSASR